MYQPPLFKEDDLQVQHALIRAHPLGLLITAPAGGPTANVYPFHLDAGRSQKGTLLAHMAKANGQWQELKDGAPALVVFQGAESYITPSWYATKQETGKVVPTWNYAMVQVRGKVTVMEGADWLRAHVSALTDEHEAGRAEAWAVSDAPESYIQSQIKGIVGLEIEIAEIAGKWKVSQNRPVADRDRVAESLGTTGEPLHNTAMADLVRHYGAKR
ncbi:transcriptional regulator [Mesorhizobium sp. Root552]|uniref:FMN-binding negative transcriptional regulator n=1 Tax=Mesorhizobium sp. Root552 TaxID=1736555 RepID=UPI000700C00D|nr:FMN-binding negative transcriptional regulator [Mesorhizobium sp. Root552]KQZ26440.1 transcriptional regulator [Mesorhizobium sp. Root552]